MSEATTKPAPKEDVSTPQGIAAAAWQATKEKNDPDWRGSAEVEFWNMLEHRASKVQSTGTATTNFEKKVQELDAKNKGTERQIGGPMSVVEEPAAITAGGGEGPASTPLKDAQGQPKKAKDTKPDAKKLAQAKDAKKLDQSGHVPTAKEAETTIKEQANSPKHP